MLKMRGSSSTTRTCGEAVEARVIVWANNDNPGP
jgi:hypothetical protein